MSDSNDLVIDLTQSFCLVNHRDQPDLIIDLEDTDESLTLEEGHNHLRHPNDENVASTGSISSRNKRKSSIEKSPNAKIGGCSICCETLGKREVSSTICGHLFCMSCLKTALRYDKRCPQCRKLLIGTKKYIKIYLPLTIE